MKSIAMRCTQEDWDSVKSEIERFTEISYFENFPYLVTNLRNDLGLVSNSKEPKRWGRKIYETFDKDILFDALDIEEEEYTWQPVNMKFFDGNKWVEVTDAKVKKPKNPELTELKQKAKSLGFKLVPLFLLLFFNLGFSQNVQFAIGVDAKNAIVGSEATGNNKELNYLFEFAMVSRKGIEVTIGYESFNAIKFDKYSIQVGYQLKPLERVKIIHSL